jgi:hypothetical protein
MRSGRVAADGVLVGALAGGSTIARAAELAGVSQTTVYTRLKNPDFKAKVAAARREMLDRAIGHLAEGSSEAAIALRHLALSGKSEAVRLGACRAVLELGTRLRESVEMAADIEELKRELQELKDAEHTQVGG